MNLLPTSQRALPGGPLGAVALFRWLELDWLPFFVELPGRWSRERIECTLNFWSKTRLNILEAGRSDP